jgi:hypothetical protein
MRGKNQRRQGDFFLLVLPSHCPFSLLRLDHRPAAIMPAVRTDDVRRNLCAAFRAGLQLLGLQTMMRAAHAGAGIRLFAFRDGHGTNLLKDCVRGNFDPSAYAPEHPIVNPGEIASTYICHDVWNNMAHAKAQSRKDAWPSSRSAFAPWRETRIQNGRGRLVRCRFNPQTSHSQASDRRTKCHSFPAPVSAKAQSTSACQNSLAPPRASSP